MLEALDLIALFTILVRDVKRHISQRRSVTFSVHSLFFVLESHFWGENFSLGGIVAKSRAIPSRVQEPI